MKYNSCKCVIFQLQCFEIRVGSFLSCQYRFVWKVIKNTSTFALSYNACTSISVFQYIQTCFFATMSKTYSPSKWYQNLKFWVLAHGLQGMTQSLRTFLLRLQFWFACKNFSTGDRRDGLRVFLHLNWNATEICMPCRHILRFQDPLTRAARSLGSSKKFIPSMPRMPKSFSGML